jgi:ubiquitin-like 1-activating enzyme E1 B
LVYGSRRPQLLYHEPLQEPNPKCYTCRPKQATLKINTISTKLSDFIKDCVQNKEHGFGLTDEIIISEESRMIYDPDFEDNMETTLSDLGLTGKIVTITPESGEAEDVINVRIIHW